MFGDSEQEFSRSTFRNSYSGGLILPYTCQIRVSARPVLKDPEVTRSFFLNPRFCYMRMSFGSSVGTRSPFFFFFFFFVSPRGRLSWSLMSSSS